MAARLGNAQATEIQQREEPPHPVIVGAGPGGVLRHRRDVILDRLPQARLEIAGDARGGPAGALAGEREWIAREVARLHQP